MMLDAVSAPSRWRFAVIRWLASAASAGAERRSGRAAAGGPTARARTMAVGFANAQQLG
jgi:hypothetical protein